VQRRADDPARYAVSESVTNVQNGGQQEQE